MEKFAFIIHPIDINDVARKYKVARYLPGRVVEKIITRMSAKLVSHIVGVRSLTGTEAEGWFLGCPLTSRQMMSLDPQFVTRRIIEAGKMAEDLGAKVVGLGAFTSVVGDAGITIKQNLGIAVTTGNSYTIATAIQATRQGAALMNIDLRKAKAAVVGATGSIGKVCAQLLARDVVEMCLVDLNRDKLDETADLARKESKTGLNITLSSDINEALKDADVVLTVTSSTKSIIEPEHLKQGAVVCDVARPRDVSHQVTAKRNDVLVIEGGVVSIPGDVEFNFNFGFPPRTAYACMSETMIIALEGTYESYTLGRDITLAQVDRIAALADKHGFRLAGFRSFERALTDESIDQVRKNAGR